MTKISLQIKSISKDFPSGEKTLRVLQGLNIDIQPGRKVAMVGRSGSGKSTLLHIIGTLDKATKGQILYSGADVHGLKPDAIADWRNRNIGFVFQFHRLLPDFTAEENVMMPALIAHENPSVARKKASALLEQVGLADRAKHKPSALSGGEQQRVAVARALIMEPSLLLADEPTGNLDPENSKGVFELLLEANRKGATLLLVTHNMELTKPMDDCYELTGGKLSKL